MSDTAPAKMVTEPAPRRGMTLFSAVWLVPLVALAITLGVAWQSYSDRGELIEVEFADATGVKPGETLLKFRDVDVGTVEEVKFTDDLENVLLEIRVNKDVAQYIDASAQFWLARPEVSAQGISRLDTVLSGTFVEGFWDSKPGPRETSFVGLERAPVAPDPSKGTWIVLSSAEAPGIANGAPVLFRGLKVGSMSNLRLSDDDETVLVDAFIEAPHDQRLTSGTVFWDSSGFSVSLGAQGLSLDVRSISSLVQGGVEFDTLVSGGVPVAQGERFRLYGNQADARDSLFTSELTEDLRVAFLMPQSVRGLMVGAPVHLEATEVGRVASVGLQVDEEGARHVQQRIVIALSSAAMGLPEGTDPLDFLAERVAAGLRAKVSSAGLFNSNLSVDLVTLDDAAPATLDRDASPYPVIPALPPEASDLAQSAQGMMTRISDLPLEDTLRAATEMMRSVTAIARAEDTRAIPGRLADTLEKTDQAVGELGQMVARLNETDTAGRIASMVEEASKAATSVEDTFAEAPALMASLQQVADNAAEVGMAEIGAQAEGILADLRALLGTEDAERLPRALSSTLDETAALLADLRAGGAAENLNGALASAEGAAASIQSIADELPQLITRLNATLDTADSAVSAYGGRSDFNRQAQSAMRELSRAAAAFGALARTIERNPRAFILGR